MKTSNLLNTPYFLEFTTRLVCSENGSHISIASSQFSTITSLSKGFDSSLNVLKFLIDILEKTKANHLALECLTSIFNPTVSFETRNLRTFLLRFFRSIISSLVNEYYLISFCFNHFHLSTLYFIFQRYKLLSTPSILSAIQVRSAIGFLSTIIKS